MSLARAGLVALALLGCTPKRPAATPLRLQRVILYQNGIGYFERRGQVAGDTIHFDLSRHEVDDVLKTLTVIDRLGGGVATVDIPEVKDKDRVVRVGVKLSQGNAHDVQVNYAIPTPTWKAAYRVVLDDAQPTGLLQGWAMINNVSQEDWDRVQLTLATGAPMSYALDLHTPQYAMRPDATGKLVAPTVLGPVDSESANAAQTSDDTDQDKVANIDDLCADDPEDKDGFEDEDGCPDPDNDKDRIADRMDKCPNEPEVYNGFDDDDGCPDRGRVIVTDTAIEILDFIYFQKGADAIQPMSYPIADAVADTLLGNPNIKKIEVQGHTDATEGDPWGLASRRAAAIRGYLVKKGVAGDRLVITPYGSSQPLDQRKTEQAYAKNRRVGFLILKRDDGDDGVRTERPASKPSGGSGGNPRSEIDTTTVNTNASSSQPVEVAGSVRYELAVPVSIKHGGSTMVSILNKQITAEDVFLFRPDGNAPGSDRSPFRAVRLVNSSGYTLQPGPIAIFARGTFVGDSLVGGLDLDATSWIPYALDRGTTVTHTEQSAERGVRIVAIHKGVVSVENALIRTTKYTVAVGRQPAKRIFIRHPKAYDYTVKELPPGSIDQGDAYLVALPISSGATSEISIEERSPRRKSWQIRDARTPDLAVYVDGSGLSEPMRAKLATVIALRKELAALDEDTLAAQGKLTDVAQRAYEIRENIKALDRVKNADDLRKKLVASLAATTIESDALTKTIATKTEATAAASARLDAAVRDLEIAEAKP